MATKPTSKLHISIGIPSGSDWKADFALSLIPLILTAQQPLLPGVEDQRLTFHNMKGSILPRSREKLAQVAIEEGATHLLFIDSDMKFPPWILMALLERRLPVVAANCVTKQIPPNPTARRQSFDPRGEMVYTHPEVVRTDSDLLEQVWRVGTGVMLIETSVFTGLPKPWFDTRWEPALNDHVGEDWFFCERLEAAGIPIYVDHRVSAAVGHLGTLEYDHTLVEVPNDAKKPRLAIVQ